MPFAPPQIKQKLNATSLTTIWLCDLHRDERISQYVIHFPDNAGTVLAFPTIDSVYTHLSQLQLDRDT